MIDLAAYTPTGEAARTLCDRASNDVARGLLGSTILKIAGEIRAAQAEGRPVCDLTVGDFAPRHFPIPEALGDGIAAALQRGETNYPPADGLPSLRAAVAALYERELGLRVPLDAVLVASGARPFIYAIYGLFVAPGDKVLCPVPNWNNPYYCQIQGAELVEVPCGPETAFLPRAHDLEPHLGDASLLVLNSPQNPSGTVFDRQELEAICDGVIAENRRREAQGRRPLLVLFDQVYWMLCFGGRTHHTPHALRPEMTPYTFLIDGVSKSFAGTGLRVGYAIVPVPFAGRLRALLGHIGAWAPKAEQSATAAFLQDATAVRTFLQRMSADVVARLDALHSGLGRLAAEGLPVRSIPPMGAIYLSAQFDVIGKTWNGTALRTNEDVRLFLLAEAGLGVVPFDAFGFREPSGWMRLSVGSVSLDDIRVGVERIGGALRRLGPQAS